MDRRIALKNMGLSLGYAVAMPTLISLVQSCKNEKVITWVPDFFSKEQGSVLTQLVDIILPKTDTPSASEVKVDIFIDKFANEVMLKEQQDFAKMSMGKFLDKALKESGKEKIEDLTATELEPTLSKALKATKDEQAKYFESINSYNESIAKGETVELDDNIASFAFANNLRGLTIWGYKTSEYVGEQVLEYLPVPGEFIACGELSELTKGKAWSL